jgi:hypothetical protein
MWDLYAYISAIWKSQSGEDFTVLDYCCSRDLLQSLYDQACTVRVWWWDYNDKWDFLEVERS